MVSTYEFHRYDGAGHGFFYYHAAAYRQAQAVDGWQKVFAFLEKYLSLRDPERFLNHEDVLIDNTTMNHECSFVKICKTFRA